MAQQMTDPAGVAFSPQEVGSKAVSLVERRQAEAGMGVTTGLAPVDAVLNPHRPGELRSVIGFTSNGKSALMNYIARRHALKIKDQGEAGKRCVVTVTWEQSIEEQGVLDIAQLTGGAVDVTAMMRGELTPEAWTELKRGALQRGTYPWWIVGHSSEDRRRRPRLTMADVGRVIEYIQDVQGYTIDLVTLDYLQRIRPEGNQDHRISMMGIVDSAKDMALQYRVPVMLGCQAKRDVKERKFPLPGVSDGQETSNLEQSSDGILSVWLPKNDYPLGEMISYGNLNMVVTDNLMVLGIMKQKFGPAPKMFLLNLAAARNEITALDTVNLDRLSDE